MKSFNRYLMESRELNPSELIMEGRIKTMNAQEWLNSYYCPSYSRYTRTWGSEVLTHVIPSDYKHQDYEIWGVGGSDADKWQTKLKENEAISKIKVRKLKNGYISIAFAYDADKDNFWKSAIEGEAEEERKAAEKFAEEVKNTDLTKYKSDAKHIAKMKAYYNKHSDPERLVNSIKDDKKLVARWIAAIQIGWVEAEGYFVAEIQHRKLLTKAEIVAYEEKYNNEKADTSDMKSFSKTDKDLAGSWITRSVYKYLESLKDVQIEWLETFKNAKTQGGKEAMRRNGRAWTEGFAINIKKGEKERKVTFDVITNEGGGLYGYSFDYGTINLKEFKRYIEYVIKNM